MPDDLRVLVDDSGTLGRIVDALHDVVAAFRDRPFVIIGGIAVLTHVQGHRVTGDIDTAARGAANEIREELLVVAEPDRNGESDLLLPNGVPVDLLVATDDAPRPAAGRGARAKRREATGHALRWAIDTGQNHRLVCEPENARGPVTLPVAAASALLALKAIALTDPGRGKKAIDDRLDLWLLLTHDVDRAVAALEQLEDAPAPARRWAAEVLIDLLRNDPGGLLHGIGGRVGAPQSVADIADVWSAVVEHHLPALRR